MLRSFAWDMALRSTGGLQNVHVRWRRSGTLNMPANLRLIPFLRPSRQAGGYMASQAPVLMTFAALPPVRRPRCAKRPKVDTVAPKH